MTDTDKSKYVEIDKAGRLIIPAEMAAQFGIKPGTRVRINENQNNLQLQFPSRLSKLYIEPTNLCNLDCRTCIRNVWTEPMGKMSEATFARVLEGLSAFSPSPSVFFGGFGEPLFHPDIVNMVARVKALGAKVELITNGTLLTREMSRELVQAGLDVLWVSLDGATPESYTDIRLGAALPNVLENITNFQTATREEYSPDGTRRGIPVALTKLGIVFVAMKRNIADLPAVINIAHQAGAEGFMVTNVLPYTKEMLDEVLYYGEIHNIGFRNLSLPGMDVNDITYGPIYEAIKMMYGSWAGINSENARNRCPFIAAGAGAISWDGNLSPCLPLMHSHSSYIGFLQNEERTSRRWVIGNVTERSLSDLWHAPEHLAFRERVQSFDFSPCTSCGACDLSGKNEADCINNVFPTCGSCLWAQGVIQCP